jgi:hypothetical protein
VTAVPFLTGLLSARFFRWLDVDFIDDIAGGNCLDDRELQSVEQLEHGFTRVLAKHGYRALFHVSCGHSAERGHRVDGEGSAIRDEGCQRRECRWYLARQIGQLTEGAGEGSVATRISRMARPQYLVSSNEVILKHSQGARTLGELSSCRILSLVSLTRVPTFSCCGSGAAPWRSRQRNQSELVLRLVRGPSPSQERF